VIGDPERTLALCLGLASEAELFPWQRRLLADFLRGQLPEAIDLPTGFGKTSVMAIWLVARAAGAPIHRRLVYVVDRRTVVDQATTVAERLRAAVGEHGELNRALGLDGRPLPISTLRGQYVDNREWLADPTAPAIVVGTVDMVGSRLLFSGYGVTRRMRPYQAGPLGVDALHLVDEAHLVPPYVELLREIQGRAELWPARERLGVPPLRVISLSATTGGNVQRRFGLQQEDLSHPALAARARAGKRLEVKRLTQAAGKKDAELLVASVVDEASRLCEADREEGLDVNRYLIYVDERKAAQAIAQGLRRLPQAKEQGWQVELIVGQRRVRERSRLFERLKEFGFVEGRKRCSHPAFVVATSAGEVGIDMDSDRLVCDLVAWERMIQRFGRVNRRGEVPGGARITVFRPSEIDQEQLRSAATLLERLVQLGGADIEKVVALHRQAEADAGLARLLELATTQPPLRPPFTAALGEDLALTSIDDHGGRPKAVWPWLRGWKGAEQRETILVWRRFLPDPEPVRESIDSPRSYMTRFFRAARPLLSEQLALPSDQAADLIIKRAQRALDKEGVVDDRSAAAVVLDDRFNAVGDRPLRVGELAGNSVKDLREELAGKVVVLAAELGGLDEDGVADEKASGPVDCADDLAGGWASEPVPFAVGRGEQPQPPMSGMRERLRLPAAGSGDEPSEFLCVWLATGEALEEEDRSLSLEEVTIEDHNRAVARLADRYGLLLSLPAEEREALHFAAVHHDLGKGIRRWQMAFSAPAEGGPYAKTRGPFKASLLGGYRHELGTLLLITSGDGMGEVSEAGWMELSLHLIAAHHGNGRPLIQPDGCDLAPPSTLAAIVDGVARRFGRLQRKFGPWYLAWLEGVLRAADQRASAGMQAGVGE